MAPKFGKSFDVFSDTVYGSFIWFHVTSCNYVACLTFVDVSSMYGYPFLHSSDINQCGVFYETGWRNKAPCERCMSCLISKYANGNETLVMPTMYRYPDLDCTWFRAQTHTTGKALCGIHKCLVSAVWRLSGSFLSLASCFPVIVT